MRLLNLSLQAVGPFTATELDLSAGQEGLHLIHGPNEAGKTSALRALSHLLFGFPVRTDDAFLHPYDQLRVGATLRHSTGETLQVLRRKGNKNTLRAADDSSPIAIGALERFLGGIDRETFENLFGIDHIRLRSAGEEIRTGQGRLGELLFAAGTGLAGLGQAKQTLQDRLDTLFKPRGQNQRINQALAEFREAQEVTRSVQLPSEQWLQHDLALRDAQARADQLVEQIHGARRALNGLTRVRDAIPLAARRRRIRQALEELGDAVRLRDAFGDETRQAQDTHNLALRTIEQAKATIEELQGRLEAIHPNRGLLEAADEIEALTEELGAVEKGLEDRQRLENWLHDNEHKGREILVKLRLPRDLDAADELRLRADEPARIRALGNRSISLRVQRDEARNAIAKHEEQRRRIDRERSTLGPVRDVGPLRRAVRQARKAGDLDAQLVQARRNLQIATQQAGSGLSRLAGWSGSFDDLACQSAPMETTVDRFDAELHGLEQTLRGLDDQLHATEECISQYEDRLRVLDIEQDVPTEDDLRSLRRRRDEAWHWLRDAVTSKEQEAFLNEFAPGRTLSDAFEQSVLRCDGLADRLRREAERVARKAEWLVQLDSQRAMREALCRSRLEIESRLRDHQARWNELLAPLGVSMPTPAELRSWLRLRAEVLQRCEQVNAAQLVCAEVQTTSDGHRAALSGALASLEVTTGGSVEALASLLELAENVLDAEERSSQARRTLDDQEAEIHADLARDRDRIQATTEDLDVWRGEWSQMMARIGLEPDAEPEQAEVVLSEMQTLFQTLSKRRDNLSRIRGIDRDAMQFANHVAGLCQRVAPELQGPSPSTLARELARRLGDERRLDQERSTLTQHRERETRRLGEAESERAAALDRLDRLCREARCQSADDLPEAERRSRERVRLEDDLLSCEEQLLSLGGGLDVSDFAEQVERADADDLAPDIARRESAIEGMEADLRTLQQTIGSERTELNRWIGGDEAALAAEKAQSIAARLQADVALYAKLKLAASVLNRGIERYREKSQGPVLNRASELFRLLTDGSFVRLQIEDDEGRALLKGARPDGRLVGVEGMSDGSHDQLYLALRLASLESWLQSHEPIPFVVDDILLNFDDRRALAALRALAELSRRTQVLFFTHHEHLVRLARAHLPADVLFVRELPGPALPAGREPTSA